MSETQLSICNLALAELGTRSQLSALNDGSQEATYCNLYYNTTRNQALRAAHWSFAKSTEPLVLWKALPGTPENPAGANGNVWLPQWPAPPWVYSYLYPADCIQARKLTGQPLANLNGVPLFSTNTFSVSSMISPGARFEVATDKYDAAGNVAATPQTVILTNQENAIFDYTFLQTTEALWPDAFVAVMYSALAGRMAQALTGDKALARDKITIANNIIETARISDGNEGLTINDITPDWLRIRGVGGGIAFDGYMYPYGELFALPAFV